MCSPDNGPGASKNPPDDVKHNITRGFGCKYALGDSKISKCYLKTCKSVQSGQHLKDNISQQTFPPDKVENSSAATKTHRFETFFKAKSQILWYQLLKHEVDFATRH